jgi:hypothetical protein
MDISDFKIGDTVFMDTFECEVMDIIDNWNRHRIIVRNVETNERIIVNPEDLH